MNGGTTSLLTAERGQTLQDYALGIGVFLVTVFFVATLILPSMLAPFQDDVSGDNEAIAGRVSTTLLDNGSVQGRLNELNATVLEDVVDMDADELRDRYRIPETSWVNISIETLNGSDVVSTASGTPLRTDRSPDAEGSATSARIVTLSDGACRPACRMIVRVW